METNSYAIKLSRFASQSYTTLIKLLLIPKFQIVNLSFRLEDIM